MNVCFCMFLVCLICIYFGISHKLLKFLVMPFKLESVRKSEYVKSKWLAVVCQSNRAALHLDIMY